MNGSGFPAAISICVAHQIDPRHQLGHRMLDLDPRVHFEEVKVAIGVGQELYRSGAVVTHRLRGLHRDRAHLSAHLGRDERRRRLLDHLLIAPLDGTFALEYMDRVALLVGQHLDFDMARALDELLDVETSVAE